MFKKFVFKSLSVLSLLAIFTNCQIGLGESVDTDAPNGEIISPGVNAVIRDAFAIKGEWKDDGSVTQVKVNLRNTITRESADYNAVVNRNGSWICAVDPEDENLPLYDGKYLATITLIDDVGHSTVLTRSYTIDNTPPVVILSHLEDVKNAVNPGVEVKTYGRVFSLNGKAADDNNIANLEVRIYGDADCDNELLEKPVTKHNIALTIEQNVASFNTPVYDAIYGNNENGGTKQLYCRVWAYDEAQRYPVDGSAQSEEDKLGNCQKNYYLQKTLEITKANGKGLDEYSTNDLYAMFSNTYTTSSQTRAPMSESEISSVKQALNGIGIDVGTFKINPKNNPYFTVIGLNNVLHKYQDQSESMFDEAKKEAKTGFQVTNGDKESGVYLQININPGLDGYSILNDSVKYYLQECDKEGNVYLAKDKDGNDVPVNSILLGSGVSSFKTDPLSTVNYANSVTGKLETGKYYRVVVEGTDTKENSIDSDYTDDGKEKVYAFYLAAHTGGIEIYSLEAKPDGKATDYVTTNIDSKTVTDVSKDYRDLNVKITYSYTGNSDLYVWRKFDNNSYGGEPHAKGLKKGSDAVWSEKITAAELKGHNTVTYLLKSEDGVNFSRDRAINLKIDDTKPEILNNEETPITKPEAKDTSNTSFQFTGQATDTRSGVAEVWVRLENTEKDADGKVKTYEEKLNTTEYWTFTVIKDGKITDEKNPSYGGVLATEGKKKAVFWAVDKVGLKSDEVSIDWIYKDSVPELKVTGYKVEDGSEESKQIDLMSSEGDFTVGKKFTLKGITKDEYGVAQIKVVQTNAETGVAEEPIVITSKDKNNWTDQGKEGIVWSLPELLPLGGVSENKTVKYKYQFTVTDKAGVEYGSKVLTVTVDDSETLPCEIENPIVGQFGDKALSGNSLSFEGTYDKEKEKTIGIKTIRYAIEKNGSTEKLNWNDIIFEAKSGLWNFSKSEVKHDLLAEGKYTLYVKAIDGANKESEVTSRDFCVDQSKPEVKIEVFKDSAENALEADNGTYKINDDGSVKSFILKISASDANKIAGVTVKNGDDAIDLTKDGDVWTSAAFAVEGSYNFTVEVEDGSGNGITGEEAVPGKKVSDTVSVIFDKTAPEITVTNADEDAESLATWFTGTSSTYITGTSSDTGSRIKSRTISIDGGAEQDVTNSDEWNYKLSLEGLTENDESAESFHKITVKAEDAVGNSTEKTYYFRYDKAVPTLTVKSDKENINAEDKLTISGQVYDGANVEANRAVKTLEITATKDGTAYTFKKDALTENKKLCGDYSYVIDGAKMDEGSYIFTIKATDYAKNDITKTVSLVVDKTAPKISQIEADVKISSDADNSKKDGETKWYKSQTHSIVVSTADTATGSGIETVEWCTSASDSTDEEAEWQPLTKKAEGEYKGTVTFTSEGLGNKLYVRVTDKAGNSSKFATKAGDYVVFNIDTTKPALALSKVQIGSNDSKITNGTEYINNTASITLYGTYSNTISGVEALSFGKKDSTPALADSFEYFAGEIPEGKAIETLSYVPYSSIKDKAAITYWKAKFENKDLTTGDLYVNGSSVAGLSTDDTKLFKLNKDTIAPNVRNIKLSTSSNKYKVYQPEQKELVFFVNNTNTSDAPQTFTIFGIAEDGNTDSKGEVTDSAVSGVAKVELAIEGLAKQSSSSASFSEVDLSKINGESTTATLTVTDNAGNSSEEIITIKVDNAAPKGVHALDSSENGGKDLYFRVGEQNRDDGVKTDKYGEVIVDSQNNATATEGAPSWNAALDKDVGGKYSGNTFSNAEKIKLRGRYDDSESGVNLVYYKIYSDQPDSNKTKDFLNNYERDATGYFSLSDKEETRRVFYTGAVTAFEGGEEVTFKPENGGTTSEGKNFTDISTNYKATLAGLNTGRNYIVLVAVDNVGNATLESVKHNGVVYDNYLINVDTQAPEINSDAKLVTNASKDLKISGSVQDNPSELKAGIKDVWVKYVDSQKAEKKIKAEIDETGIWTVSIAKEDLTALYGNSNQSKTVNFTAIATDNAGTGNTSSCNTTVVIDKTAPEVKINVASMNDADSAEGIQINGAITISGTASDENGLSETEKMILECLESGKTEWTKLAEATSATSWAFNNIDTTALKDNTDYSFRVSATDSVGNAGKSSEVKATVNQDTDRPVIKFTNLKLENMSESSRLVMTSDELYGSVTDDDGVEKLEYTYADKPENLKDSSWATLDLTNSSFTLKLEDGSKNLYFKVTDNGGNSFVTSSDDEYSLKSPKLLDSEKEANQYGYKNADSGKRSTVTYITVDTLPPEYGTMQFTKVSAKPEWKNESEIDSTPVGGSQNKLNIRIPAYDVNGIASVVMKISGVAEKIEFTESTDSKDKTTVGTHTDVKYWLSGLITIPSDTATGTKACSITITDGSGKTSKDEFSILIDNKAPVVTADALEDKDYDVAGTQINGTIEITGTASDENKLSATEKMVLEYQESGTESWTKLADITSAESWTFANVDTTKLPDNTTYNFRISATDCVGNVGYSKSITAKVDQDTDRPVIKLTSVDLNKDGIKLESSGFRGTVSDDDGIPETLAYKLGANGKWIDSKDNGSNLQYTEDGAFYLTLDDGNFDVFFKVDGFESKVFAESYTPSADDLNGMVKLTDKNGNQIGYRSSEVKNTALTMTVDTTVPYLGDFEYSTDYDAANAKKAHWAKKDTISSVTLGGNTKKITVRVPAWDINKIDAENAYVEIPGVGNVKLTDSKENAKVTEYPEATWWISETAEITDTGTKTCTVSVKDTFNKESTDSFKIKVDNEGPEITLNALKDADSSESGTQINGTTSIAGKTDDESGLSTTEKMVLEYQKSGTEDWTKLADITSAESWTFKDIDTRTSKFIDTETYNFRVNATDRLGNVGYSNTVTATVDQDTDRPVIKFTNLDLRTLNASSRTLLGTTVFSGIVTDDDGVPASSTVAYKLNKDDTWHYATDSDSKLTYSDSDGSFILELDDGGYDVYFKADGYESSTFAESYTPTASELNGMVKVTDKSGTKFGYKNSTVKNTALLMTIDTTDPFIGDYEYSTDYDEAKPEKATWTKKPVASTPVFGGTKNKLRIRVPAWDANGIDETKAVIKENNIEFGLTDSETNAELAAYPKATYWISEEIDLSGNSTVTKNYTISVEDKNERPNSSKFSVLVDNTKPVITIDNLANKINKKINITGKASDTDSELSATEKMILEYQESGKTEWTKLAEANSASSWIFAAVDTTNLSDNTTYSFRVSATDTVGNTGYSEVVKATVDQDSDRPVIKFTNISLKGMAENSRRVMNSKELYGSVTDDDGVQALYYQFADDTSWHELVLENGSFKLALKEDGSKAVNFKVVDKAGTDFITSNIDKYSLETPKLVDSEDKPNQYGYVGSETGKLQTVTYITVDTKAPDLGTLQFSRNYNDAEPTWSDKSSINITPFGGTKNKLKIRIPAWDVNGISSVTMNIPGVGDVSFTEETNVSATVTDSDKVEHTDAKYWISDEVVIPNKNIEDGSKSCTVTVLDISSKESKDTFSLLVDNTAPVVKADSLKDADSETAGIQINGLFAISGKASDDNGLGSEKIELYYRETTKDSTSNKAKVTSVEDWTKLDQTNSESPWTFSGVDTNTKLEDNKWYDFTIAATDKTGNTGYSDVIKVNVDQDTDRPVIKLTTVDLNSERKLTTSDISGTVSDDDGIPAKLAYRIGSTGDFIDSEADGSKLKYSAADGTFTLTLDEGESAVYFKADGYESNTFAESYTPNASDLNRMVKLTDTKETKFGYKDAAVKNTVLSVTVDLTAPIYNAFKYSVSEKTGENAGKFVEKTEEAITSATKPLLGGNTNKLKLSVPAWDKNGIASVVLNIQDNAPITLSKTEKKLTVDKKDFYYYDAEIDLSSFESGINKYTVVITDNFERETTSSLNITVDNTAPVVTLNALKDADSSKAETQINGTIEVSGKANDEYGLSVDNFVLYAREKVASEAEITSVESIKGWTKLNEVTAASAWTFSEVDTLALKDYASYYFTVEAKDSLGNVGYSAPVTATVDQDTDRPVITIKSPTDISSLSSGNILYENSKISGTVEDDDEVTYFGYNTDGSATYTELTLNSGRWTIENLKDGISTVYFKVTAGGKDYTVNNSYLYNDDVKLGTYKLTDEAETPNRFGYYNASNSKVTTGNALVLKVDTTEPSYGDFEYSSTAESSWTAKTEITKTQFGANNKFKIQIPVWDANGIKSVALNIPDFGNVSFAKGSTTTLEGHKDAEFWESEEISIPKTTSDGLKSCSITITDKANKTSRSNFSIVVDNTAPVVLADALKDADTSASGTQINGTIAVSGKITEDNGFSSEKMKIFYREKTAADTTTPESVSSTEGWTMLDEAETASPWSFAAVDTTKLKDNTTYFFTVEATDKAGNTGYSAPVAAIVDQDTDRPVIKITSMKLDSDGRQLGYNNSEFSGTVSDDDGIPSAMAYRLGSSGEFIDSKTENSVLKYSETDGSFSITLPDESYEVYFKIGEYESIVTPSANKKAIKLTDNSGTKYGYKNSSVESTVLSVRIDTTDPVYGNLEYSRNYDAAKPDWNESISSTRFGGTQNKLKIRIPAWDANGIASVVMNIPDVGNVTFTETAVTATVKASANKEHTGKYWISEEIEILSTVESGTKVSSVTVTDKAEKYSKKDVSVIVDNTAPEVKFNVASLNDADSAEGIQINGKINVSGTASNEKDAEKMIFEYQEAGKTEWTRLAEANSASSWTFAAVDTTNLSDNTTYSFRVSATDTVGNTGYSEVVKATVDQDSDRPVIKISNISLKGMTSSNSLPVETNTLYGNISDDDGVAGLYYKIPSMSEYEEISLTNGSFTLANIPDGSQTISFKVRDNNGSEFESTAEYNLKAPKLLDSDSTANKFGYKDGTESTFAYLKVDTKAPYLGELKFSTNYVAATDPSAATGDWSAKADLSTAKFGGTINTLRIKVPAWDANYIKENKDDKIYNYIKIPEKDRDVKVKLTYTTETPVDAEKDAIYKEATYYLSDEINISALTSGTKSCSISVMDNSGKDKTSSATFTFEVDNTKPSVSMDSLTDADEASGTQINGTISITGKASDDNGISTDKIKLYFREKTASDTTDPKSVTSLDDWKEVTAALKVDENNSDKWTFSNVNTAKLDGTKEIADGKTVYFTVEAKDSLGNTGYSAPVAAVIDQDTDRPVIKFNDISLKGMSASNYFQFETDKLKGSVSDDDGVPAKLAYRFGATGDFIDSEDTGSTLKYSSKNGSFTLAFEDGSKDLYFKVTDCGNVTKESKVVAGTFESSTSYSVTSPKLIDSEETPNELGDGSTVTYIMIDTTAPSTRDTKFTKTPAVADSWNSEISKASFGGTQNKFYMQHQAFDINGVKKVYLSVPVAEKDGKSDAITAWTYKDSSNNRTTVYTKDSWPTTEKCYESYDMTGNGTAITAVSDNHKEITVGNTTYTREAYIFPLEDTEPTKGKEEFHLWQSPYNAKDVDKCKPVDVTNLASGTRIASLITFDGIKSSTATVTLSIDWDPVGFEFSSHKQDQTVYGIKEVEVRGSVKANDASKVYYCVTDDKTTPDNSSAKSWTEIKEGTTSAIIKFDGKLVSENSTEKETHDKKLRDLLADLYKVSDIDKSDKSETLKIWVYVEDHVGNKSEPTALNLNVIPNGDKPVVTISYPEAGAKLGGTIRFSGETTIETSSVSKVYAQIYVPKATEKDWESKLNDWVKEHYTGTDKIYTVVDIDDKTRGIEVSGTPSGWNFTLNSRHELEQDDTPNFTLKFIAISDTGKLSDVAERTIQIDKNAPSITDIQLVKFVKLSDDKDPDFNLFASSNITTSIPYEEGMWISGEWYLIGSVSDDNGVKELIWNDGTKSHTLVVPNKATNSGSINDTEVKEDVIVLEGEKHETKVDETTTITAHDYSFCLPIGKSEGYGSIKFEIAATDATSQDNKADRTIKVNYDNQAPEFKATVSLADNAEELAAKGNSVKDSQGMYTLYGTFEEAGNQSGFNRIAMYFTRTVNGKESILDPMVTKNRATDTTNDKKNNYYDASKFACTTVEKGGDGIYWQTLDNAKIASDSKGSINSGTSDTITVSGVPAWVRKGGLCKVDGVIYKIKSATGSSIKIDGTLIATVANETKNIYVTPALVIDHLSAESKKQGQTYDGLYYNKEDTSVITGGDGDWLIEAVTQTTTSYQWTASIKSQNIKDGPVTIHFVAFDKAGNASEKSYEADVANNAPRIAGVTVWTDYNGNGKGWRSAHKDYDDETNSRYYSRVRPTIGGKATYRSNDVTSKLIVSGTQNDVEGIAAESSTSFMKVTDTVKFIPEIVGGNDELYYEYKIGKKSAFEVDTNKNVSKFTESNAAGKKALASKNKASILNDSNKAVSGNDDGESIPTETDADSVTYVVGNTDGVITFGGEDILANLDTSTANNPTWFDIVISDSTEGDRQLSCEMQIALQVNYKDESAPWAKIKPFYWNGYGKPGNNGVRKNSVEWNNSTPLGHIELEDDLSSTIMTNFGDTANAKDPKVSGKIVFEGTAYDDIRLSKLYAKFTDLNGFNSYNMIGEYVTTDGVSEWKGKSGSSWSSTVTDVSINSEGHTVKWTVTIDTSKVANGKNVVGLDRVFSVYAIDARGENGGNSSVNNVGTTQTKKADADAAEDANWTAYYKMDVVPYITGVETALQSKLKSSIKNAYSRTALGHYIARSTETVSIKGFNLTGAYYGNDALTVTDGVVALPVSKLTASGNVALKVASGTNTYIETLNNINNDNAKGLFEDEMTANSSYDDKHEYAYNRMANKTSNNNLTDNVYIDVWEFDSDAAVPVSGDLREPVMKINPVSGMVGFAFVSGPADFAMAGNASDNSYKIFQHNYATFSNVSMTYDDYGNSFGTATGLDTYPDGNSNTLAGRFTFQNSHWGPSAINSMDDNYWKDNKQRLEAIGLPGDNRCYVKGVYPSKYTMTETRFYSPSIAAVSHGQNNTSVYLAYYDSVQRQIRFRYNSQVPTVRGNNYNSADKNDFVDNRGYSDDLTNGSDGSKHVFESYTNYFSLIAGVDWQKVNGNYTKYKTVNGNNFYDTGYEASKYVAIDAIAGNSAAKDVVVAVWFDGTDCYYAYNTNPTSGKDNGAEGGWTTKKIITEGGEHCAIKVGPDNSIHIAANKDGKLVYVYIPTYAGTPTSPVTVDSYGNSGEKINIDVGRKTVGSGYVVVPYISYYMSDAKRPAVASLVVPSSGTINYSAAGTDEDSLFTGNWEVSLVPTTSTLGDWTVDKINIGLWKKIVGTGNNATKGVITTCKDDAFTYRNYTSTSNQSTTTAGNCFGNGTANPIMGYSIVSTSGTCIETAQMK